MVGPGIDHERAAWRAVQGGVATLAVVDGGSVFLGFIPQSAGADRYSVGPAPSTKSTRSSPMALCRPTESRTGMCDWM